MLYLSLLAYLDLSLISLNDEAGKKIPVNKKSSDGGTGLYSQHLGGRGRQISEFETSLVYKESFRIARAVAQKNPVLKKNERKEGLVKHD